MRTRFLMSGCLALLVTGCASHQAVPLPGSLHAGSPSVVQTGKQPIQWTQFLWGGSTTVDDDTRIITGPDGRMWYSDANGSQIIRMSMSGARKLFPLSYNGGTLFNPEQMTVGADGNFYILPFGVPLVGVVTTSGVLTTFPVPSGDVSYLNGITKGPDGNVWFVEQKHVAKITPSGVITEYPFASGDTTNSQGAITTGSDGNLWVTEPANTLLTQVNPTTGAMTSVNIGCQGYSVVSAADKNLWVNCSFDLARVTTGGAVTTFPTGFTMNPQPSSLAVGPDGNPWFAVSSNNVIGEFNTLTDQMTIDYPPNAFNSDYALTAGPDGNVWALDSGGEIDVYIIKIITVTPKNLTFAHGALMQSITVSENGATSWTAKSSKTSVATVAQGSPADVFNVTSVAAGKAQITVNDGKGNSFSISVTVQ
jgi:streptogramin lyase